MPLTAVIDGDHLVVRVPLEPQPELSKSGKSFLVANTGGFTRTEAVMLSGPHAGSVISVSLNAIVPNPNAVR